jgi:hypothetical protein
MPRFQTKDLQKVDKTSNFYFILDFSYQLNTKLITFKDYLNKCHNNFNLLPSVSISVLIKAKLPSLKEAVSKSSPTKPISGKHHVLLATENNKDKSDKVEISKSSPTSRIPSCHPCDSLESIPLTPSSGPKPNSPLPKPSPTIIESHSM